jgi:hypothetical protein
MILQDSKCHPSSSRSSGSSKKLKRRLERLKKQNQKNSFLRTEKSNQKGQVSILRPWGYKTPRATAAPPPYNRTTSDKLQIDTCQGGLACSNFRTLSSFVVCLKSLVNLLLLLLPPIAKLLSSSGGGGGSVGWRA